MRRLHQKVNLIPVIAKSDTLTDEEITSFKQRILNDIAFHKIEIFSAPIYDNEDEETILEQQEISAKVPFAVVGSNTEIDTPDGRRVRGRAYPWGVIEVDNEEHCDFVKLRQMLIHTHMEELKENTNFALYEKYRSEKLIAMGVTQDHSVFKEVNPAAKMAEERTLHEAKLRKMENEMKLVFQQKVAEKEAKLKQSEEELYARHREMRDALEKQRLELEDKRRRLESGRPLTPEKVSVSNDIDPSLFRGASKAGIKTDSNLATGDQEEGILVAKLKSAGADLRYQRLDPLDDWSAWPGRNAGQETRAQLGAAGPVSFSWLGSMLRLARVGFETIPLSFSLSFVP